MANAGLELASNLLVSHRGGPLRDLIETIVCFAKVFLRQRAADFIKQGTECPRRRSGSCYSCSARGRCPQPLCRPLPQKHSIQIITDAATRAPRVHPRFLVFKHCLSAFFEGPRKMSIASVKPSSTRRASAKLSVLDLLLAAAITLVFVANVAVHYPHFRSQSATSVSERSSQPAIEPGLAKAKIGFARALGV
jgi:hypothetical protein